MEKELAALESASKFEYLESTDIGKQLIKNARKKGLDLKDAELAFPKYKEWKEANMNPLSILSKVIDAGGITYGIEVSGDQRNMQTVWDAESKKNTTLVDAFATFDQEALNNIIENAVDDDDKELFDDEEDAIKKLGLIKQVVYDNDGKPTKKMSYKIPYKHVFSPSASNMWQYEIGSGNSGDKSKLAKDDWRDEFAKITQNNQIIQKQNYNKQKRDFEISKFRKNLEEFNDRFISTPSTYMNFITEQLGDRLAWYLDNRNGTNSPSVAAVADLLTGSLGESMNSPQASAKAAFIGTALKEIKSAPPKHDDPGTAKFKKDIETVSKNILNKINLGGDPNDYLDSSGTGLKDIPLYESRAKDQALSLGLVAADFSKVPNINMTSQVYAPYATASTIAGLTAMGEALGSPIDISGLYRTPAYNKAISHTGHKGVHTQGRGVDVAGASRDIVLALFDSYKNMDGSYNRQKLLQDFNLVSFLNEDDHLHLEFK